MLKISLDVVLQQALVDTDCAVVLKQIKILLEERVQWDLGASFLLLATEHLLLLIVYIK